MSEYRPKARFSGLFPIHASAESLLKGLLDIAPIPTTTVTDILSNTTTFFSSIKELYDLSKEGKEPSPEKEKLLYIKFSYFIEDGAVKLGANHISFGDALERIFNVHH